MTYWKPSNSSVLGQATSGLGQLNNQMPVAEIPEVGSLLLFAVYPYGGISLVADEQGMSYPIGTKYIEVEVKAERKIRVVVE